MCICKDHSPLTTYIVTLKFSFKSFKKMEISKREIHLLLLHEFRIGTNATEAANRICQTMGEEVANPRTARTWFARFRNGEFNLDELPRSGRPVEVDLNLLQQMIEQEPRQTTRELAGFFECSHTTIEIHLHNFGKIWKYGVWVPHQLSQFQLKLRVNACMELLSSHRNQDWLCNIVTGDEKWVMYVSHTHKKQWLSSGEKGLPTPKPELHPKKIMLCVWWNIKGVIH